MKKLSWFNKIIFIINIILIISTLIGYLLPYLAPKLFPILAVFTLILPTLLLLNIVFTFLWLIQLKKQLFLSLSVFLIGYLFFPTFYKFSEKNLEKEEDDFTVLSYNVRLFNLFKWIPNENVPENIKKFIEQQQPDIICFQEYSHSADYELSDYKFRHIITHGKKIKTGQAIYSKYLIINEGEISLPNSENNVIYADIVKGKDTIRIYSLHLQSINISTQIQEGNIDEGKSKMILERLSIGFKEQQLQSELILSHIEDFKGRKIVCGDMNNTAFSYTYRNVRGNMKDAFLEAGKGFGRTYNYNYYPARIDYILADKEFEIKQFQTFTNFKNSDHFPIMARLKLKQ